MSLSERDEMEPISRQVQANTHLSPHQRGRMEGDREGQQYHLRESSDNPPSGPSQGDPFQSPSVRRSRRDEDNGPTLNFPIAG